MRIDIEVPDDMYPWLMETIEQSKKIREDQTSFDYNPWWAKHFDSLNGPLYWNKYSIVRKIKRSG